VRLDVRPLELTFVRPFRTSRGVRTGTRNVVVELEHAGSRGIGVAAPGPRFGETPESVIAFLDSLDPALPGDPDRPAECMTALEPARGHRAAKAALDIALHDRQGRRLGEPLYALWGLDPSRAPVTSFTLGIDRPEAMAEAARRAAEFPVLKIKVGTDADEASIGALRDVTDRPLRVDANEGWTSKEEAIRRIEWLAGRGVELVEQPLPAGSLDEVAWLRRRSPLPLVADEDCVDAADVDGLVDAYDVVNVKLDKCGGLLACRRVIDRARSVGLKVMIGCMAASTISTTAAAHLALLADYADLDSHLMLIDDPYEGVGTENGRLILPRRPGIGVRVKE
jgi:L-alanine-DL-glutamate epimerase-like enolase superfamily enzyme